MKHLSLFILICAIQLTTLLFPACADGQTLLRPSPYYPLSVGNSWTYRAGTQKITLRVTKHETVDDVTCARLEATDKKKTSVELITTLKKGLFFYGAGKEKFKPPLCRLRFPVKPGDEWEVKSKADKLKVKGKFKVRKETVTVPAGKYESVAVHCAEYQINETVISFTSWYAADVGLVKQRIEHAGLAVVLELESFKVAP